MEGLEISEVNLSEIFKNKDFRADSDFWTKVPKKNPGLTYVFIGSILRKSQYGVSIEMNDFGDGIPIYRMNEIHNMLCDFDVNKYAKLTTEEIEDFLLKDRDVLFNRTNSFEWVGRTGLYRQQEGKNFVFASYLVRFVPDRTKILPEYLASFLSSKYGIWDIRRRARQSINQANVNPEEVKAIEIPLLTMDFQDCLSKNFDAAYDGLIAGENLYRKAENLLLSTLGMTNFSPRTKTINIQSFKNSFAKTKRLDSEYYQPKYEDLTNVAIRHSNGWQPLATVCVVREENFSPLDDIFYKYIELANIDKSGGISGFTEALGNELPTRARRRVTGGDVLVSSIEGSLESCALVPEELAGSLCSTGFYVVRSDVINSETLLILFKSPLIQGLLKKGCSGTILTAINNTEFFKIPLPIIEDQTQKKIAAAVQDSFTLKAESERLLEVAKRAVEIAIEQDEIAAITYIEENSPASMAGVLCDKEREPPSGEFLLYETEDARDPATFAPDFNHHGEPEHDA